METEMYEDRINEAADYIGASHIKGDVWAYEAHENNSCWRLTSDNLIELWALLHNDDENIRNDAYSHWCSRPSSGTGITRSEYHRLLDESEEE